MTKLWNILQKDNNLAGVSMAKVITVAIALEFLLLAPFAVVWFVLKNDLSAFIVLTVLLVAMVGLCLLNKGISFAYGTASAKVGDK